MHPSFYTCFEILELYFIGIGPRVHTMTGKRYFILWLICLLSRRYFAVFCMMVKSLIVFENLILKKISLLGFIGEIIFLLSIFLWICSTKKWQIDQNLIKWAAFLEKNLRIFERVKWGFWRNCTDYFWKNSSNEAF